MLGYPTHTSYATELLMSKSAEVVHKFLLELFERVRPLWKEEKEYLLELKEKEVSTNLMNSYYSLNIFKAMYIAYTLTTFK